MKFSIDTSPGPYGFGRRWTLVVENDDGDELLRNMLGQDAKVMSRILGTEIGTYYREYGSGSGATSFCEIESYVAKDIIRALLGLHRHAPVEREHIEKLSGANEWELMVE